MAITYETTIGALSKEDKALAQLIMPREGFSSKVYSDVDRQGKETALTAGFGHKLTAEELKKYKLGDEINHKQAVDWLKADLSKTHEASWKQAAQVPNATEELQDALHKVNYQLGSGWTQKFPTAWEHMKAGRWDQAIEEVKFTKAGSGKASKWMEQTPERVEDFTKALQTQHEASYEAVPSNPDYTEPMAKHWSEPDEEITLDENITMYHENPDMLKEEIVRKFKPKPLTGVAEQRLNIFENTLKTYTEFPLYGSPLPFKALIHYLTDSAKSHLISMLGPDEALVPLFGTKNIPPDVHRTFEPSSMFEQKHYDALEKFIIDNEDDWHTNPSDPGESRKPGWFSINLDDDKYQKLRDKDSPLWDMSKTVGTVDFKVDPDTKKITYSDRYDFKGSDFHKDRPLLGTSTGPEYQFTNPRNK
jgi:GH24 family phage-related lysozyme (muramidase)